MAAPLNVDDAAQSRDILYDSEAVDGRARAPAGMPVD